MKDYSKELYKTTNIVYKYKNFIKLCEGMYLHQQLPSAYKSEDNANISIASQIAIAKKMKPLIDILCSIEMDKEDIAYIEKLNGVDEDDSGS